MSDSNSNYTLSVTNKELFEFYDTHCLDFEKVNLMFLGLMGDIISNIDASFNASVATKLLTNVERISSQIEAVDSAIHKQQADLDGLLRLKFADNRKDFIEEIKRILTCNNVEQMKPMIKESTDLVLSKTSAILAELVPHQRAAMSADITANFNQLKHDMATETAKLFESSLSKPDMDDFKTNIIETMTQVHGILTNVITASEHRTDSKINDIKQMFLDTAGTTNTLQASVFEMLKKFEKGSGKGNVSEHVVYNILLSLYPCAQIDHVGNDTKESGDIIIARTNKPKILIENKDHDSRNVPKQEVDKFIRDCTLQNCCGIMLAQNRGITNKENFEIQIHGGNVLLFVHEVGFCVDKIKTAIEIVENFKLKLDEHALKNNNAAIDSNTINDINRDFAAYIAQKHAMLKMVKDFSEKMTASIADLKMPALEKYLGTKFANSNGHSENICKYCEKYVAKSMMQHYRYCSAKQKTAVSTSAVGSPLAGSDSGPSLAVGVEVGSSLSPTAHTQPTIVLDIITNVE